MAIRNAVQRGNTVYVYDERGHHLFSKTAGSGPNDGLQGYTSGTVSIRVGKTLYVYDERGHRVGSHSV